MNHITNPHGLMTTLQLKKIRNKGDLYAYFKGKINTKELRRIINQIIHENPNRGLSIDKAKNKTIVRPKEVRLIVLACDEEIED